jgi:hemolysin III|tara:strand:- start:5556 stop:6176 length:621 start_codon:yes stop_codon:yes gene_type:complete
MESKEEEFWNTITHFIGLVFSLIGLPILLYYNRNLTEFSLISILFFEFGMICVYTASTLYHYTTDLKFKKKLRIFDHISIFYLVAGSYAPICLITLYNGSGLKIFISVFIIAILGSVFKIFFTGKYERFSLFLYLAMGWLIVLDFNSILNLLNFNGLMLLLISGFFYSFGTVFYSLQKMKYSHAIWHLFVMAGSTSHYFLVLLYVV